MNLKKVFNLGWIHFLVSFGLILVWGYTASAGIKVWEEGDKYLEVGGRIQLQYHNESPDTDGGDDEDVDELFFRRLRPYIEGKIHPNWLGKIQWDMGGAEDDDEVDLKDAYIMYSGVEMVDVILGNYTFPYSREVITSSKRQQLVERTFVGDHNYGVPERNLGIHLMGDLADKRVGWGVAIASASLDPNEGRLDFDTPVNQDDDFNQGWIYGGRIDFFPLGPVKFAQGDFKRDEIRFAIGAGVFGWNNDDDNNTNTSADGQLIDPDGPPDVDQVVGYEIDTAFRGLGISVDAEYNSFTGDSVVDDFTGGLFEDGETDFQTYALEGGYMILPSTLEVVAGYQALTADAFEEDWTRVSFGLNYYIDEHDIKIQATYRIGENVNGIEDNNLDELFVQVQYVFE